MKSVVIVFLCLLGVLALVELSSAQDEQPANCDNWSCSKDCGKMGRHGQCDPDDVCRCYECIYRPCRQMCKKVQRIGQCDETRCLCL